MEANKEVLVSELAVVIVDFGLGSKVLKTAKRHGVQHGIVLIGRGTLNNRILEFLRLADIRKEIAVMVSDKASMTAALNAVDERFHFNKPFHGIAFTMSLHSMMKHGLLSINDCNQLGRGDNMYRLLMIIVDRGKTEEIMEAATKAGARGGTILKARSAAGDYDSGSLFGIDIEPEKEILLILAEAAHADTIIDAVRETLATIADGDGVIICQNVNSTFGVK